MLADVELGEVEPEDLDLAQHVVQVAGRGQLPGARPQRRLDGPQVGKQLVRCAVRARAAAAGRADALAHERQRAPVGLLRVECGDLLGQLREALGALLQDGVKAADGADDPLGEREAAGEQLDARLEQSQAAVAHEGERLGGDRGGHVRVAVAVAPDPRAEAQQRGDRRVVARGLGDRVLQVAVHARHLGGQRRDEPHQAGAHLVEHRRRDGAQLVRAPQLLHRRREAPARRLDIRQGGFVELAQDAEDAGQLLDRRTPPRFGGMRGEDQAHLRAVQQPAHRGIVGAVLAQQPDGVAHRPAARRGRLAPLPGPHPAHALVVLGEVDELEPAGERAHEHLGGRHVEPAQELAQRGRGVGVTGARLARERDGPVVHLEDLGPLRAGDDVTEHAEQKRAVVEEGARRRRGLHDATGCQARRDRVARAAGRRSRAGPGYELVAAGCVRRLRRAGPRARATPRAPRAAPRPLRRGTPRRARPRPGQRRARRRRGR